MRALLVLISLLTGSLIIILANRNCQAQPPPELFKLLQTAPQQTSIQTNAPPDSSPEVNILDGCHHVYLDVGTNIGGNIRKLYEPNTLPGAPIMAVFDKYFGPLESRRVPGAVCAVGWVSDRGQVPQLERLEQAYNKCGWKVNIQTTRGPRHREEAGYAGGPIGSSGQGFRRRGTGIHNIRRIPGRLQEDSRRTPGRLQDNSRRTSGRLQDDSRRRENQSSLAQFIKTVVASRRLPILEGPVLPPSTVMRLDLEGKEMEVIADLMASRALDQLASLQVAWQLDSWEDREAKEARQAVEFLIRLQKGQVNQVAKSDAESGEDLGREPPAC